MESRPFKSFLSIYIYTEFNKDKTNKRTESGSTRECLGTFELLKTDSLKLNTNCNIGVAANKVSELTITTLIIDYQVRVGGN
jgi:hypothetical protein